VGEMSTCQNADRSTRDACSLFSQYVLQSLIRYQSLPSGMLWDKCGPTEANETSSVDDEGDEFQSFTPSDILS
jgi:hypothetical protein